MATFPDITPTYGLQKNSAPNVRIAQFGSGYSQRSTFGINQNPKVYSFTFKCPKQMRTLLKTFWMHAVERKALTSVRQRDWHAEVHLPQLEQVDSIQKPCHNSSNV